MYPRRMKTEAFSNAVDVVERLRDPTKQVPDARHLHGLHTFSTVTVGISLSDETKVIKPVGEPSNTT